MNIKAELDAVISAIQAILGIIEKFDPNAKNNPFVVEAEKVIMFLKALGL